MKITSTPQQQQFTGCYVLKDTQNAYKTIVNEIMPTFRILAPHHPVFAVKEDLIFNNTLSDRLSRIAAKTGYSQDWLVSNARQHGVKVNLDPTEDVYVFTGKDFGEVFKYMKSKNSLLEKFRQVRHDIKIFRQSRNLPNYLREVDYVNRKIGLARDDFRDFTQKRNCEKVSGLPELMLTITKEL